MGGKHKGKKGLSWTRATAEKNICERLLGPSLASSCQQGVVTGSQGSRTCLALNGEDGGAFRGLDWDL